MKNMVRFMRRMAIRWQLRSLDQQAASILEARDHALSRLIQIRREQARKILELKQADTYYQLTERS